MIPLRNTQYAIRNTDYAYQTGATTINYTYDDLYRLTDASYSTGQSFGYSYDAVGNRLTASENGSQVMSYSYDVANRLTQTNDLVQAVIADYLYDDNGNLLDDGDTSYSYDSANRLTSLADGVSTMSYEYNGDGVRVAQIVDGLRTDYVQDIGAPLPQVLTARQGGTVSQYLRGLGLIGEAQGGTGGGSAPAVWQYHLPDALGSVRQVVDAQGAVTLGREYDPFGGLLTDSGTSSTNYGFAGEEQDPNTEQIFLRARTYNPNTGRFLQQDSVLGSLNEPRTLHRYTYSFNNPVNYTDPAGRMPGSDGPLAPHNSSGGGSGTYRGGSPQYIPNTDPPRSANDGRQDTYSDATARQQSQGFRPSFCGIVDGMRTAVAVATEITQEVLDIIKPIQDGIDIGQDWLYDKIKDTAFVAAIHKDAKENPVASLIFAVLADTVYDLTSLVLGHDLSTGEKLSHGEELLTFAALFIPLVAAGVVTKGLNGAQAGSSLIRHGDEALDGATFAARHADELGDATRAVTHHSDEILDAASATARHGDDLSDSQAIARRLDDWVTPSNSTARYGDEVAQSRYADEVSEARHVDNSDNFGGSCAIPARNSFTAGTIVETDEGDKPIETIEEGDNVLGEDPETGEQGYYEVVSVRSHLKDEIVAVTIKSEDGETVMETTPDHPVYVEEKGWLWAENLEPGDKLRTSDDTWAEVVSIEHIQLDEPELVYNFTVKGPHTYFVMEVGVLVHNCTVNPKTGVLEPQTWAPRRDSAHSRDLQRAFIASLEDGEVMAVRGMDWGVWSWERLGVNIPFKPMAATDTIYKGPAGYRLTNAGIFLADADVAWVVHFDPDLGEFRLLDNHVFHNEGRLRAMEAMKNLGHKNTPVLHGPHMNVQLMFEKQGKTAAHFGGHDLKFFQRYYDNQVFVYGRNFNGQTGLHSGYV